MKDESFPLTPPNNRGQSHDEIAAEFADHLAAAEAELTKRGATTDEAQTAARMKFGDVEKIKQTCYWIQNGETIMLRWTLVSLAAALCILLGLSVIGNWRTQSQLADEMGKLSTELKAIAAAKQTPPPVPQPPEITGLIYAGSKDKPVANAGITVIKTDGTIVRKVTCDDKGRYRSGPMEAGDYCITIETVNPPHTDWPNAHWVTQSQPVFIYGGSGAVPLDIDTSFHPGTLRVSASRALPEVHRPGKFFLVSRLHVFVKTPRKREHPWTTAAEDSPVQWPLYAATAQANGRGWPGSTTALFKLKDGEEFPFLGRESNLNRNDSSPTVFPAGQTPIAATLMLNVFPIESEGNASRPQESLEFINSQIALDGGGGWWKHSRGKPWLRKLTEKVPLPQTMPAYIDLLIKSYRVDEMSFQTVAIKENTFTRIRAEIPEGIEEEIEMAIEKTTDYKEFAALVEKGLLTRPVKLTVIGHEATD